MAAMSQAANRSFGKQSEPDETRKGAGLRAGPLRLCAYGDPELSRKGIVKRRVVRQSKKDFNAGAAEKKIKPQGPQRILYHTKYSWGRCLFCNTFSLRSPWFDLLLCDPCVEIFLASLPLPFPDKRDDVTQRPHSSIRMPYFPACGAFPAFSDVR
jgi:hypothetical protein